MEEKRKHTNIAVIKNISLTILCVVIGIVIALQIKGFNNKKDSSDQQEKIASLQNQLIKLTQESESLEDQNEELQDKINALESDENREYLNSLVNELAEIKKFAGMTKVQGKGIYIELDFPTSFSYTSIQSHLTLVINDLRASDAQAISINGERILAMTELKIGSNGKLVVNGRLVSEPYIIRAIGDTSSLQSGMNLSGQGIIPTMQSKGVQVDWYIDNHITIEACRQEDYKTDLLNQIK